jgi:hypothetical protein
VKFNLTLDLPMIVPQAPVAGATAATPINAANLNASRP